MKARILLIVVAACLLIAAGPLKTERPAQFYHFWADHRQYAVTLVDRATWTWTPLVSGEWERGQTKYVYENACVRYVWDGKKDICLQPKPLPHIHRPPKGHTATAVYWVPPR